MTKQKDMFPQLDRQPTPDEADVAFAQLKAAVNAMIFATDVATGKSGGSFILRRGRTDLSCQRCKYLSVYFGGEPWRFWHSDNDCPF